jgi:hypothetical protein
MKKFTKFLSLIILVLLCADMLWAQAPSTQASNISFSNITTSSVNIGFNRGNGSYRLVVIRADGNIPNPTLTGSGVTATFDKSYGNPADELNDGSYFVYYGTAKTLTVTNLQCGTTYNVRVYEYNKSSSVYYYNSSTPNGNPRSFSIKLGNRMTGRTSFSFSKRRPCVF